MTTAATARRAIRFALRALIQPQWRRAARIRPTAASDQMIR
jgi:hypothetical protein